MTHPITPLPTRTLRLARLGVHFVRGLWLVATRYRRLAHAERAVVSQRWARHFLQILNIQTVIVGDAPLAPPNTLVVANHVSWLDIFALSCGTVSRFVAKREIRDWPLAGYLAHNAGTIFIDRSRRRDASRVNQHLAHALEQGGCMTVFPEATTSDGSGLLPFKASLFESVRLSGGTVLPVALRYLDADGHLTREPAYIGEISLLASLRRILRIPALRVEVSYGAPLAAASFASRFALADAARTEVARGLRLSPDTLHTAANTPDHRPAVTL